jgi:hypothetical protein
VCWVERFHSQAAHRAYRGQGCRLCIQALLGRTDIPGICKIVFDHSSHPAHDPGVFNRSHEFLRPFLRWEHALVLFDHDGCGQEDKSAAELGTVVEERLAKNGWGDRAKVIVLDPELEVWLWDSSFQANRVLDWPGGPPALERWLRDRGHLIQGERKPGCPKEAFLAALRHRDIKRSSALYRDLALDFRVLGCTDRAFLRLVSTLRTWFAPA